MVKPKIGCAHCLPFLAGRRVLLSYATAKSLPLPSTDLLSRDRRLPSYRDGRVCIQTPLFTYPRRGGQRAWIQVGNLHRTCEIRVSSAAPCSLHFDAMTRAGSLWSMMLRRTYRPGRRTIWPCFSSRTYSRSVFCRCFFLHTKQSTDGGVCLFMYHHVLLRLYFFRND
jgi:hypothetical protein